MKNRIILFVIILLGCVCALNAQNREYSAEIDTNYIMIGDQIHFRMKVKAEPGVKVAFPQLKDTIAQGSRLYLDQFVILSWKKTDGYSCRKVT